MLGGSRKYPLKEPFVELLKGSLATCVNAMTFPDMTTYPVASQNTQDFYNLIEVYLDAVFYPRLTRETWEQEGGIMKGAYASAETVLSLEAQQALFPDTVYGMHTGGHPLHIPKLTYEQLKAFYATHYHPSNARIFFSGDDPPAERLRILDAWLSAFDRAAPAAAVSLQAPFAEPRTRRAAYPVSEETPHPTAYVVVNWVLAAGHDPTRNLAFELLQQILLGSPAAPLRRALRESQLGEALANPFDFFLGRQLPFAAGLKGVAPADPEQVRAPGVRNPDPASHRRP